MPSSGCKKCARSEEHTSELQSHSHIVCRLLLEKKKALGQKRGISLNSSDTTIKNSYISDCKAVGQDSQAITGFNRPGNYLIENNHLEGAAETVMFGGSDPLIPNLVPS